MLKRAVPVLLLALQLGGCGARDCWLGIAHRDCDGPASSAVAFPQDDAVCRGYGLSPDTHDYAMCRHAKARERTLTARETDYGFLQDPLTPTFKP